VYGWTRKSKLTVFLDGKNAAEEIADWRRKMREIKKVNKIYAKWRPEEKAKQKLRIRGQPQESKRTILLR
jgi:hypothetical protein